MSFGNARQMGFNNPDEIITTKVIVTGPGEGVFSYSPSEALGNLIGTTGIAIAGTDALGNAYLPGNTVYLNEGTGYLALQQYAGTLRWWSNSTFGGVYSLLNEIAINPAVSNSVEIVGPFQAETTLIAASSLATPVTSALLEVQGSIATEGTLEAVLSGVLETWHTPTLGTGFASAGTPNAAVSYQYEPINGGRVRLRGQVNLTANQLANATIFTLPAAYTPIWNHSYSANNNLSGYSATTTAIRVEGTAGASPGAVMIGVAGTSGNFISLDGIVVDLN